MQSNFSGIRRKLAAAAAAFAADARLSPADGLVAVTTAFYLRASAGVDRKLGDAAHKVRQIAAEYEAAKRDGGPAAAVRRLGAAYAALRPSLGAERAAALACLGEATALRQSAPDLPVSGYEAINHQVVLLRLGVQSDGLSLVGAATAAESWLADFCDDLAPTAA